MEREARAVQFLRQTQRGATTNQYGRMPHGSTAQYLLIQGQANSTEINYGSQWRTFVRYCTGHGVRALRATEATVVSYIASPTSLRKEQLLETAYAATWHQLGRCMTVADLINHYKALGSKRLEQVFATPQPVETAKQMHKFKIHHRGLIGHSDKHCTLTTDRSFWRWQHWLSHSSLAGAWVQV